MKITNISQGPRGIHTTTGSRIIPPGETIEAELSEVEFDGASETGWFDIAGEPDDGLDRDELKKQADELGIKYAKNIGNAKLKELIDVKLAS